jgi:hypothetical protein
VDVVIVTELWLREEICKTKVFRADFTTSRRDQCAHGRGVFICIKTYIACAEVWVDKDFEMNAVEVQGMDPKYTWEIRGIYRAPYDNMWVTERLAGQTGYLQNSTKHSIIRGDLILAQEDCNGSAEGTSRNQAFINRLV